MKAYKTAYPLLTALLLTGWCALGENQSANTVRVVSKTDKEAMVSMTFDETPLADVIKAFRDATGANIISSGTNL
jgi:type II secretory pathway component HofQ